ncbi:hypothetical protein [Candidatus Pelagibacter sp.]|uniref:hypothetical protein n=1 Tax=Candidatus Pelagibacter sp. TaxID=2024849 RepID=UPI003F84E3BC
MIKLFLNKFLNNLSFWIFKNRLPYYYNFFNLIHNYKILNKKSFSQNNYIDLGLLDREGFTKVDIQLDNNFKLLKEKLYNQNIFENQKFQYRFKIDDEISKLIKGIYASNINLVVNKLENFYNSKIIPVQIYIARNYNFLDIDKEYYSNKLHMDAYLCTYFKLFINISDVHEYNGPLHVISKKHTASVAKKLKYYDRNNYKKDINIKYYKHVGKSGSSLLCNTTQCYHKAGIPEKNFTRDMMTITFLALPRQNIDIDNILDINESNKIISKHSNELIQKLKPKNIRDTIKIYKQYKSFKEKSIFS